MLGTFVTAEASYNGTTPSSTLTLNPAAATLSKYSRMENGLVASVAKKTFRNGRLVEDGAVPRVPGFDRAQLGSGGRRQGATLG